MPLGDPANESRDSRLRTSGALPFQIGRTCDAPAQTAAEQVRPSIAPALRGLRHRADRRRGCRLLPPRDPAPRPAERNSVASGQQGARTRHLRAPSAARCHPQEHPPARHPSTRRGPIPRSRPRQGRHGLFLRPGPPAARLSQRKPDAVRPGGRPAGARWCRRGRGAVSPAVAPGGAAGSRLLPRRRTSARRAGRWWRDSTFSRGGVSSPSSSWGTTVRAPRSSGSSSSCRVFRRPTARTSQSGCRW